MRVKEYLHSSGITPDELAVHLGYKTTSMITRKMDEEMPKRWVSRLEELESLGMLTNAPAADGNISTDNSESSPSQNDEWISSEGRESDKDPNINNVNSGVEVVGPQKIKLTTIKGYIEMVYGGAESLARARGDMIAAETIHRYTPEYVEAWLDYIKFDDRILKYLEMLNVGTPLGNLVGIHAISVGAYVLARVTAKELADKFAAESAKESEI